MKQKLRNKNDQAGFSLMELLVVMVVMLIVLAATFTLLRGSVITATTNYEMTTAQQNLRNSQEFLTRDILTVGDGLFGMANIWLPTSFIQKYLTVRTNIDPSSNGIITVGSVISDNNLTGGVKVSNSNLSDTVLNRTDRLTMLAMDSNFSSVDLAVGATDYLTGRINIPASRINEFAVGEIYYISNGSTGVFGAVTRIDKGLNQIFWEENDKLRLNYLGANGNLATGTRYGKDPATLLRMNIKHYYVDSEGKLVRRVFGVKGTEFIDSVIAEHVVSLQFRYILSPSNTGKIFDQPKDEIDLSEASLVRMIEATLGVETTYPLQDGYKHQIEGSATIGVRNVQFLQAPVPRDSQGNTQLPNPQPTPMITPTPTPTPTPVPTPISTPTPTPTPTPSPSAMPTPTPVPSPSATPVPTPTPIVCQKNEQPAQTGCICQAPMQVQGNGQCKN